MARRLVRAMLCVSLYLSSIIGCSDTQPDQVSDSSSQSAKSQQADDSKRGQNTKVAGKESSEPTSTNRTLQKVRLTNPSNDADTHSKSSNRSIAEPAARVRAALKPLQLVLVGDWRGITNKTFEGFKSVSTVKWVWDHQTDENQPALVMTCESSPYIQKGRLTYLLEERKFQFSTEEKDGTPREYRGDFSAEPRIEPGDDDKLQHTYKLQLTQKTAGTEKETWQIVFNQQTNDRYLMELSRSHNGGDFRRLDTIGTQRQGTSFALSDTDFKEKTCIISEGLGTIQVSHKGKSYWVCCSGCKAAFEEEPERWVAKRVTPEAE